jgi:hypothetical protein
MTQDRLETNQSKSEFSAFKPVTPTSQTGVTPVTPIYTRPDRPIGHTDHTGLHNQVRQVSIENVHTLESSHGHGAKGSDGRDKRKGKKPKLTFNELMAKYVKMRYTGIASQPSSMKPSRSPPRCKSEKWNRQGNKSHTSIPYPPVVPITSMPYGPSPTSFHPYSSWGWYGTWTQPLSYYAPCHFENAAPRRPQPHVKSPFDETNRRDFQEKKKVVKQIYRVKKDNHKDKSSDLSSSDTKPNVAITTSANIGKDVKQQVGDAQGVKSEPMELEVSKVERKLPIPKSKAQLSHPLDLPNWQMRKLQKLNVEELKVKNMSWVTKQSVQVHDKNNNEMKGAKETKRRRATKDHSPSLRFAPNHQNYWSSHNPYFTSTPSMPILYVWLSLMALF